MDNGWIKLHRKLLENPIMQNAELLQLFIYCLLRANHETKEFIWNGKMQMINRGSFITGLNVLCKDLKQRQTSTYRRLGLLVNLGYISIKSENKFSIITVLNYNSYQLSEIQSGKQTENKRKTNGKQTETNKNDNNDKNDKKEALTAKAVSTDFINDLINDFKSQYLTANGIAYKSINGKDRKAMGGILAYYKEQKPDSNSEITRHDLNLMFRAVLNTDFKNEYLNSVSIAKLNTSFNDYYQALKSKKSNDITIHDFK